MMQQQASNQNVEQLRKLLNGGEDGDIMKFKCLECDGRFRHNSIMQVLIDIVVLGWIASCM